MSKEAELPQLNEGQSVLVSKARVTESSTKPPARFDQASLLDTMIKRGIGRPSTYASIIGVIHDRGYVREEDKKIVPTWSGHATVSLLEREMPQHVDFAFTSQMEDQLDRIAQGKLDRQRYLEGFYAGEQGLSGITQRLAGRGVRAHNPEVALPQLRDLKVRFGASGAYVEQGEQRALLEGAEPHQITQAIAEAALKAGKPVPDADRASGYRRNTKLIGTDPVTGFDLTVREGRFGPYAQLGEGEQARRGSIPSDIDVSKMSFDQVMLYINLNRVIGLAPDGEEVRTGLGKFGPFIRKGSVFRGVTLEEAGELSLEQAMAIINAPKPRTTWDNKKPPTRKQGARGR